MSPSNNGAPSNNGVKSLEDASSSGRAYPVSIERKAEEVAAQSADSDQTASDSDQTASDSDQTASDSDQTASDSDRSASERDQIASDRESAGDADQLDRDQASDERDYNTRIRDKQARVRGRTANSRDTLANERARAAVARDRTATIRDDAAEALAGTRSGEMPELDREPARHREQAAKDRASAAEDRRRAAADRIKAATDRAEAVRERGRARREMARAARELEASETDELTHVRRRGAGLMQLQREMDRARRVSEKLVVGFIDVDGLKQVNDAEGHGAGDALLIAVADCLRTSLRSYDLVMRFGGDEFVCVLPKVELSTVRKRFIEVSTALTASPSKASITAGLAELAAGDSTADVIGRADADLLAQRQKV
jgi:diguanylate cyclase (GGDEF)-like protein